MAARKKKVKKREKKRKEKDIEETTVKSIKDQDLELSGKDRPKIVVEEELSEPITPRPPTLRTSVVDEETVDLAENDKIDTSEEKGRAKLTISLALGKKLFWIGLPTLLLIGALVGVILIYFQGIKKIEVKQEQPIVTVPSPMPTETPKATPTAELKREDLKLQVLNGRGVAGIAAKAREFLESLGYQDVEIGNADSFDYEETEVSIKEDKKDYFELLRGDLSEKYTLSVQTSYVDKESGFDAFVVIGKK